MAVFNISTLLRSRRAMIAIVAVVPLVGAAIAVPALMSGDPEPLSVLVWTLAVLVSILIHELGHAFMQRGFGGQPYMIGNYFPNQIYKH